LIQEEHLGNLAVLYALVTLTFGIFIGFITYKVWRSKHKGKVDFMFQNTEGIVLDAISDSKYGFVLIGGEYWKAKSVKSTLRKAKW
jgi:membrane-bound ClpP family serine protease